MEENLYYEDDHRNKWSKSKYSKEEASMYSKSCRGSFFCTDCEFCVRCRYLIKDACREEVNYSRAVESDKTIINSCYKKEIFFYLWSLHSMSIILNIYCVLTSIFICVTYITGMWIAFSIIIGSLFYVITIVLTLFILLRIYIGCTCLDRSY